jgi:arylsulfatase A-like enzyme
MSRIAVARFFFCIYLPLAWAQSALATARFSSFTQFCGLVLVSLAATLLVTSLVWLAIQGSGALMARLLPRVERWRWSEGAMALVISLVIGALLSTWLAGLGLRLQQRFAIGALGLGCAAAWFWRPGILRAAIETATGNAWQVMKYPLLLVGVVCTCGTLAGLAASHTRAAAAPRDAAPKRSLLLITIDTFSASRSSLYEAPEDTTPFLRGLAGRSVVFDMALSTSNFTAPGLTSIHTGQYPWTHRVLGQQGSVRAQAPTLASTLAAAGYQTAFFNANWWGDPRHTMTHAGWDEMAGPFQALPLPRSRLLCANAICDTARLLAIPPLRGPYAVYANVMGRLGYFERVHYPTPPVFDAARDWIASRTNPIAPQFLWIHVYGPHDPYLSPAPFLYSLAAERRFDTAAELSTPLYKFADLPAESVRLLELRYQEMLRYTDDALRSFLTDPAVAAFAAQSVVAITSDHGESFERRYLGHSGPLLTQSLIRIPLLVQAPELASGRVAQPVSQADIFPTLLALLDLPVPDTVDGVSQLPALRGAPAAVRPIYSMNLEKAYAQARLSRSPWSIAVVDWPWKLVDYSGHPDLHAELYDLRSDPREARNLAAERPADVARLSATLRQALESHD